MEVSRCGVRALGVVALCCLAASPAAMAGGQPAGTATDVVMFHNDPQRTGLDSHETLLTPSSVGKAGFGWLRTLPVDGKVDAQPLYLHGYPVDGAEHDVLYAATENDSVYAYDADDGRLLWHRSLLEAGESPSDARGCRGQVEPTIGITATPVIDRAGGTLYVVAMSKGRGGDYHQRLHALDLATGAERNGGPVEVAARVAGNGAEGDGHGHVAFRSGQHKERMALTLVDGVVYTSWSSHCDFEPYTGWVIAYDARTLERTGVLAITPNGSGGSLWSANGGPAVDAQGHLYLMTGNGTFDTKLDADGFPVRRDYGNSFLELATAGGVPKVLDYFTMSDSLRESRADVDLGSGGAMVLPDGAGGARVPLLVGAGKDRRIYVLDRDELGGFDPDANHVYQQVDGALVGPVFGSPACFDGIVYFGAVDDRIKAFPIIDGRLSSTPGSETPETYDYPGATPSISADGRGGGILWALQNNGRREAVLRAYDARDLADELYSSDRNAAGRLGRGNKFVTPTIADGKVFIGTRDSVVVFGLPGKR